MKFVALCVLPIVVAAWFSVGFLVLQAAGVLQKSRRDLILCCLTGFGLIGMVIAGLGFLQLWYTSILIVLIMMSAASGLFGAYRYGYGVWRAAPWRWPIRCSWVEYAGLFFLLIYGICALLPPTGIDELMYHLSVPRLYFEHHGFYNIIWNQQANLPMLAEMNYALGMVFENHILCRLIAYCASALCVLMVAVVGKTAIKSRTYLWLAALIFLSHTNTIANFNECNVDLINAAFILAAFWFVSRWKQAPSTGVAFMAALMLGFVLQSKAFGILCLPVALAAMVVPLRKVSRAQVLQIVLMIGLPLLCGLIWYAKSHLYQGVAIVGMNALAAVVAPTAAGSQSVVDQVLQLLMQAGSNIIAAPWSYSLLPVLHRMDSFGPLFLGILPFMLLIKNKRPMGMMLFWGCALWLLFIVLSTMHGGMSIRYLSATVALFSIGTAYVIEQVDSHAIRRFLLVWVIAAVGLNLAMTLKRYRVELISVLKGESWHEYLMKNYLPYPALDFINTQTPSDARVAAPYCFGTYYINRPYEAFDRSYADSAELIDECHKRGISYLLANDVLDTNTNRFAFFAGAGLELVFGENSFRAYKVPCPKTAASSPAAP